MVERKTLDKRLPAVFIPACDKESESQLAVFKVLLWLGRPMISF